MYSPLLFYDVAYILHHLPVKLCTFLCHFDLKVFGRFGLVRYGSEDGVSDIVVCQVFPVVVVALKNQRHILPSHEIAE